MHKLIVVGIVAAMAWPSVASAWEFPEKVRPRSRSGGEAAHAPDADKIVLEPTTPTDWYGYQIIAADVTAISLVLIGAGEEGDASIGFIGAGIGGYMFGAPSVHAANGQSGNAEGSVGLRLGAPVGGFFLGGFIGPLFADCDGDGLCHAFAAGAGAIIGFMAGVATAMTVDAAFIAKKDAKIDHPEATKFSVAPNLAVTPKGAFTGLAGTF